MKGRLGPIMLAVMLLGYGVGRAAERMPTAQEKLTRTEWTKVRGVNFFPSYAANPYEVWRKYDHNLFDRELRLVPAVGYNSVRIWLNYRAYEELGSKMVDNVQDALRLCQKYHLRVVLTMFDSCGIRPSKDARWMPAVEAYHQLLDSPRFSPAEKQYLQKVFGEYATGYARNTVVQVEPDSHFMTLLWQDWQSSPGKDRLGTGWYPRIEKYVDAQLGRLQNNPDILEWDIMNEPEFVSEGPLSATRMYTNEDFRTVEAFLAHWHSYIKQHYPNQLVGIGWASHESTRAHAQLVDVFNIHIYGEPDKLKEAINAGVVMSKEFNKPVLITECLGNWDFNLLGSPAFEALSSDEGQLAHYRKLLPILVDSPIGWLGWGMIVSRVNFPFLDILYPNGHPRPAAIYLEKMLKGN